MFEKLKHSDSRPSQPTLVWDGNCGFCKFWVIRWMRLSGGEITFTPYQKAIHIFKDIPEHSFAEAARLIDTDGQIYNGPHAAYKSLAIANKHVHLEKWYRTNTFFRILSDVGYQSIADNRNFAMRVTKFLFGDNPINLKNYWIYYLMIFTAIVLSFVY